MEQKIKIEYIPIEKLEPNKWNPNEEDEEKFNRLVKSIEDAGIIQPINVVPSEELDMYRIISGEHRYKAAKVLGYKKIPCIVHKDFDIDRQKFITVRMNVIQGKLNPMKLANLIEDLSKKYEKEVMEELMGFTDEAVFHSIFEQIKRDLPEEIKEKLEESRQEIKTIDDLSNVLNRIFTEYGDTVPYNFIFFTFGGKKHLMIRSEKKLFKKMEDILRYCQNNKIDINDFLYKHLKQSI